VRVQPAGQEVKNPKRIPELVAKALNGRVSFGDGTDAENIECSWFDTVSALGVDVVVNHGLGRIPVGYVVVSTGDFVQVCRGVGAWTTSTITLRFSGSSGTAVKGFII
jgi:hypothetical protein